MASITTEARNELIALYVGLFSAAPGADNLSTIVKQVEAGGKLLDVANTLAAKADFSRVYPAFLTADEFAAKLVTNLLGTEVTNQVAIDWSTNWVKTQLLAGKSAAVVITNAIQAIRSTLNTDFTNAKAMLANKVDVANYFSVVREQSDPDLVDLQAVISGVSSTASTVATAKLAVDVIADRAAGKVYDLTAGIDGITAGAGNDTFNSLVVGGLSPLDVLDGGNGIDTLNLSDTAAVAPSPSISVKNIEIATLTSAGAVTLDASTWTGLTTLTTVSTGAQTLTAATTTNVTASAGTAAGANVGVTGGKDVTLSVSGITTGGAITVTGAKGAVSVTATESSAQTTATADSITVTGGTKVAITANLAGALNQDITAGVVTVTGTTDTTSVSVTNTKAATKSATVAGVINNSVTVTDVNAGSTTKAGTITSVSVSGYTTASISGNAVNTLSLANGSGNIIIDNSGLTTATNKTLALTANGLTGGTLDDADIYTTLNVTTATANSTLANITFGALKTLTVAGTNKLTLTSTAGLSALTTVTVTGAAGVTGNFSGATVTAIDTSATTGASTITFDPTKATFAGGAGAETVTTSAANPSKAISLGAGDDSLTLVGGSTAPTAAVSGGDGSDTLSITAADAAVASGSATFAGKVTGFEKLTLTGATNQTVDLAVLGGYNYVTTSGGNGLTLSNLSTGGTLVLNGAGTAYTIGNSAFAAGTADVLNVKVTDGSTAGVNFAATGITASGVEIVNITTVDTQTTPSGTFNDAITLLGNSSTTITVAGNAGLTLTATSTGLTSVDASGITLGGFTWTSGALATAATVKGSATGTNTINFSAATGGAVTYTGGTGSDAVTASNGKANVITLGNGTNSVTGTTGNNTITGGTGADTVNLTSGNNTVNLGDGANSFTATSGKNTYTGGADMDTVTLGGGVNTITLGAGNDAVIFTAKIANGNSYSTITDLAAGDTIDVSALTTGASAVTPLGSAITLADTAAFQDFLDAATASVTGGATAVVKWFQYGGNTYLVVDDSNGATFQSGGDTVIKLTGLVSLAASTVTADVITIV